jgi:hypothetical protein
MVPSSKVKTPIAIALLSRPLLDLDTPMNILVTAPVLLSLLLLISVT